MYYIYKSSKVATTNHKFICVIKKKKKMATTSLNFGFSLKVENSSFYTNFIEILN